MMDPVVIFGTGKAAEVATFYIEHFSDYDIVGYTVDDEYLEGEVFNDKPLVPWTQLEQRFPPGTCKLLGPVTAARLNIVRRDRFLEGKARGYEFATFVHPQTQNYASSVGENCLIFEDCTIQPFVHIGDNVIVWSKTMMGHHADVRDHCFFSSQVGLGARTVVGAESYLGGFCAVVSGVELGARSVLLNGAIASRHGQAGSLYVGQTSREIRGGRDRVMRLF